MRKFPVLEPNLGSFEGSYRQAFLKSDANQAIFIIGLSNLASLILIQSDYQAFETQQEFYILLAARLGVFLVSITSIFILIRSPLPKYHDWAVTMYMLAGGLINILINSITAPDYVSFVGVTIVLLNIYYFALFTPIHIRVTISFLFSAIVIFQAFQSPFPDESSAVIAGMIILTNVIGLVVSTRLYTHRRLSFKAHAEEIEMKIEMAKLANLDYLTDVKNRRAFSNEALEEFHRAKRYQRHASLIIIDIDNLKLINDLYGHLAGDETIKYFASMINKRVRGQDVFGRLGGDEFGLFLPETNLYEALIVGKRIQEQCTGELILSSGEKISVSLSLGLTEVSESDQNFDDLFKRADQLLYTAKNNGRNRIEFDSALLVEQTK